MDKRGSKMGKNETPVFRYENGKMRITRHEPVREFPLSLIVNGRELATLVSSPHDLRFLVAGFLRLQGFVDSIDDFQMLSVCEDFGVANVIIKGELPEKLRPALTSGCGTGITFNLQQKMNLGKERPRPELKFTPDDLYALMDQLARLADEYRKSGGIHSAALCERRTILLYSEDIGRHNTIDRLAGEALLKGIDLAGKVIVTSGRVSSEMLTKAAMMGISLIASRTSPTDLAVRLADEAGITLIGYVRGSGFNVYSHPESLAFAGEDGGMAGVTAVILAGGGSTRMKSNKALLPFSGELFIERIYRQLAALFPEVIVVTDTPELYQFLPCRKVPDIFPKMGSLAGIHSGLVHAMTPYVFVVACDMPYLNDSLIKRLAGHISGQDVVIAESGKGLEPLHAFYGKGCIPAMEDALRNAKSRIIECFDWSRVTVVSREVVAEIDPEGLSFRNINTPEEYFRIREEMREVNREEADQREKAR